MNKPNFKQYNSNSSNYNDLEEVDNVEDPQAMATAAVALLREKTNKKAKIIPDR